EIRKRVLGVEHPDTLASMRNLALTHRAQGKFAEAESVLREALAIRERNLPDDWQTFSDRSLLGSALAAQKKFLEAEPFLVSGYEGMNQREEKIPAASKARLKEALERLVRFYTDWEQPLKAAAWQQKLDQYTQTDAKEKAAGTPKSH